MWIQRKNQAPLKRNIEPEMYFKKQNEEKKKDSVQFSFNLWSNPSGNAHHETGLNQLKIVTLQKSLGFRTLDFTILAAFYGS